MSLTRSVAYQVALLILTIPAGAQENLHELSAENREFFEDRIRPVLVEHCYRCHNSTDESESDLALDHRAGIQSVMAKGHKAGVFSANESRLLRVMRHEVDGLEMPVDGPKLDARIVADFETWLTMGAPDPRDQLPSAEEIAGAISWPSILHRRKQWWSFQPIQRPDLSFAEMQKSARSESVIDILIDQRRDAAGLQSAQTADRNTLIRRLYFALIGLPPAASEVDAFANDKSPDAYARLVDRLLDSEHFGERWARHWMDWVRYAESHGSEGDPRIDGAEHYRDYLIRALNADVPYDQLLREHIAGDLLDEPRVNQDLGINESLIGTAHWRMVFHGFAPTDALDERVRFTDDAIDVFSKAFLGLTVSCARCHDHKFDAISQADYYALFGILSSTRPGRAVIDLPDRQQLRRAQLAELKLPIRGAIAEHWLASLPVLEEKLGAAAAAGPVQLMLGVAKPPQRGKQTGTPSSQEEGGSGSGSSPIAFREIWQSAVSNFDQYRQEKRKFESQQVVAAWNLADKHDYANWFRHGIGLPAEPHRAGEFTIAMDGAEVLRSILPSGVYSHSQSDKHAARLESPDISLEGGYRLWLRVAGGGQSMTRYVVQNYPRNGTVFPVKEFKEDNWLWQSFDLDYWQGDKVHIELTTAKDAPLLVKAQERSWFGIRQAVILQADQSGPPASDLEHLTPLMQAAQGVPQPPDQQQFASMLVDVLERAILAWRQGDLNDSQALLLDRCQQIGLLPNSLTELPSVEQTVLEYRKLEKQVSGGTRIPTLSEWKGSDTPLFARGDHRSPQEKIPRRFLEAIDQRPYETQDSGRLKLATDMLREDNPFTARTIVNRIWHHLFGQGIVTTTDNLGSLGTQPTHPKLLDYLAAEFRTQDDWSIKKMIRRIVTSRTWRQSSSSSQKALQIDPENRLYAHFKVRRLEAEAIRDALLASSGKLDLSQFGPAVPGNSNRRSVYVNVIRNRQDPFLFTFDAPVPFSAKGRRDVTNVPAQSLLLMNNPRVRELARALAERSKAEVGPGADVAPARVLRIWQLALSRSPSQHELDGALNFLKELSNQYQSQREIATGLEKELTAVRASAAAILEPARQRLLEQADLPATAKVGALPPTSAAMPQPLAEWKFDSLADVRGDLDLDLKGSARLAQGHLELDGRGWAETGPVPQRLAAKTLEVLVQLSELQQRGGGVFTVQNVAGSVFDSIVFAERAGKQWLPGSNNFRRTRDLQGALEEEANERAVHLAMVYTAAGRITCYRDGRQYGISYKISPQVFSAGDSMVLFGMRHGHSASGNRMLRGNILEARLYARALNADEVASIAATSTNHITGEQILAALNDDQRRQVALHKQNLKRLEAELKAIQIPPASEEWTDLAHSIFNMKEFIYVR